MATRMADLFPRAHVGKPTSNGHKSNGNGNGHKVEQLSYLWPVGSIPLGVPSTQIHHHSGVAPTGVERNDSE